MQRLRDIFEPMKKSFLIAHLQPTSPKAETRVDPDDVIENEICDTRQSFLNVCQANHFQFDQLRRAKHSTTMLCYSLHNPTAPINSTDGDAEPAKKPASREAESAERRRARQKSVDLHMRLLIHSSSCTNPQCPSQNCRKMKVRIIILARHFRFGHTEPSVHIVPRVAHPHLFTRAFWSTLRFAARGPRKNLAKSAAEFLPSCKSILAIVATTRARCYTAKSSVSAFVKCGDSKISWTCVVGQR